MNKIIGIFGIKKFECATIIYTNIQVFLSILSSFLFTFHRSPFTFNRSLFILNSPFSILNLISFSLCKKIYFAISLFPSRHLAISLSRLIHFLPVSSFSLFVKQLYVLKKLLSFSAGLFTLLIKIIAAITKGLYPAS